MVLEKAVAQVQEVKRGFKRATSAVGVVGTMPLVDQTGEEASAPQAFGVRRAGTLLLAAREVSVVVVRHAAVADSPVAAGAGAAGADVGEQERKIGNKRKGNED